MANQSIMKRRFKQWSSIIPPISTKQPTTYHFWNILATVKNLAIKNIINLASSQDDNSFIIRIQHLSLMRDNCQDTCGS